MEIISITNNKGGVGKTTTAVNIAVGLSKRPYNKRVLVIDIDAQVNASRLLGWDRNEEKAGKPTIYTALRDDTEISVYDSDYAKLWICPASELLDKIEGTLKDRDMAVLSMRDCLERPVVFPDGTKKKAEEAFDYIIIDCPSNMGLLTRNALACANWMIIPITLEPLPVEGLGGVLKQFMSIRRVNPSIGIKGIVRCMVQAQLRLAKDFNEELERNVGEYLCKTMIPKSTATPTSQIDGKVIIVSNADSAPAVAYKKLLKELFPNKA